MVVKIGRVNRLKVLRIVPIGAILDGDTLDDILLPTRYVPRGLKESEEVDVFIYLDSEDRIIATTETPLVMVGEFACLDVVSVSTVGAFLDWGLMKDLFVPFREQNVKMEEGKHYVIHVYLDDDTKRIAASSKVNNYLDNVSPNYSAGDEVDLLIYGKTELGYKAIINNLHSGILYHNQVFRTLNYGQKVKGYINKVREDDKIDLLLDKPGYEKTDSQSQDVLNMLKMKGGYMAVTDKSDPDEINRIFGMSKKNFKKALGALYKNRLILIEDDGIRISK
jgi:uncharacterized protein